MVAASFLLNLFGAWIAGGIGMAIGYGIKQHWRDRDAEDQLAAARLDAPASASNAGAAMNWNRIGRYRNADGAVVRAVLWDQSRSGANAVRRLGVDLVVPLRLGPEMAHFADHERRTVAVPPNHWVVADGEESYVVEPDRFAQRFRSVR